MNMLVTTAVRGAPVIVQSAKNLASRVFAASPAVVDVVAKRTGITGGARKILDVMSSNKTVAALVLMDLGAEGANLLSELSRRDTEVAELVKRYGFKPDAVDDKTMSGLAIQAEEVEVITEAANALGGLSNLHKLRKAMTLSEDHFKLYDQLRLISRGLAR